MGARWGLTSVLVAAGLLAAACSADAPPLTTEQARGAEPAPTASATADPEPTTEPDFWATPEPVAPPRRPSNCPDVDRADPSGPAASTVVLSEDPLVEAVVYPRPDYEGNPWSQWGQGAVLDDGRFVSAIGDHIGADGNSYLYEFDPVAGQLALVADVLSLTDHQEGDWGYGKIHGQLVPVGCEEVVFSTYWGTRNGLEYTDGYSGDLLVSWNTTEHTFESLGVPVPAHGLPSLAGSAEVGMIYGEAVDPFLEGNQGVFFAYDLAAREVVAVGEHREDGFRNVLVDASGKALFATADSGLGIYEPDAGAFSAHPTGLPDGWLRSSTVPAPDGTVYGSTRNPDALFVMAPDGQVRSLGAARGYVASLALSADAETIYYVPGAHGSAWEQGTPVVAVDGSSGEESVLVELNDAAEEKLGLRLGGTYNVAADPDGSRLYIGFNAGAAGEESFGEVVLVVVHLQDSPTETDSGGQALELRDVTEESGLVEPLTGMHGHAAAAADFDGDGWEDLLVGTFGDRPPEDYAVRGADGPDPDRLLGGGRSGFASAQDVASTLMRTSGAAVADLDGDDDLDVVLARNVRNDEDETVVYENVDGVLREAVVLDDTRGGRSVGVLDVDADGQLDLLLTEDKWTGASSAVFRNQGDFSFENITAETGLPDDVHALGIGVGDLTGDGSVDLVFGGSNRVFVARGDGTFREAASSPLAWEIFGNEDDPAGVAVADLNRDGLLDVVIGQHHNSTIDFDQSAPVRLFLNRGLDGAGDPVLEDVTAAAGLVGLPTKAPHVQIADLDNDGWPEIVTSASAAGGTQPAIFRHLGAGGLNGGVPTFEAPSGLGSDQYWVTGAVSDFDRDGRQDVFLVEWEPSLPSRLWRNESAVGNWIEITAPIGATVLVYEAGQASETAALVGARPVVGSTGYGSGSAPVAHFGLGASESADVVVVLPGGDRITEAGLDANSRHSVAAGGD